ncbi:hypothetical protein HATV-3_gp45 [Haloarcula tailed virus 3]|uniref:Uncharacterized protein n=1 Tax=Haloarcula tailed virus 3 TaxID=2877990 RepID=A0AAE9BYA7_9CAUD|nr:hypothetical protein M1M35_gp45 [Haloarcula tailed virus 3]UBF23395.1 hypothetical protein HATV-3_gp45 [Haloarcula tailed virus 3]
MSETIDFGFAEGDTVLVRVRENGTRGNIVCKFEAECADISGRGPGSKVARFPLPFGTMNTVTIRPYEAEFEITDTGTVADGNVNGGTDGDD